MQLQIEPDLAIPLPVDNLKFSDLKERALAACNTAELLGLDVTPTSEDKSDAEKLVYQYAEDGEKTSKAVAKKSHKVTPAAYYEVKNLLDEFSIRVVDNAMQIRLLVTNKLLLDSGNEDPRVRIRALELLGKITDVGLFTEKSEVTINHRSTQDLTTSLREKIRRLMMPEDTQDVEGVEVAGETIDVDKELGINIEAEVNSKSDPETPAE